MIIYLILYALIGVIGYTAYRAEAAQLRNARQFSWVCFGLIFLLLALRHPSMGGDLGYHSETDTGYLQSFDVLCAASWKSILTVRQYLNYEFGYMLFNKFIGTLWQNRQFFLGACAFVSLFPVGYMIRKQSVSPALSWVIYLALPIFEMLFSGLRQGIAMGICFLSILPLQKKKPFFFLLSVLAASLFHDSALVFLIAYPIYHIHLSGPFRFISVAAIPVIFLLRHPIFELLCRLVNQDIVADNNNAIAFLLLLSLIYVLCCLFYRSDDRTQNGFLNLLLVCSVIQVFSSVHVLAQRVGFFFMFPLVLLLPAVINNMEPRLRIAAKFAVIVFFVVFGLWRVYGSTWSMMYPYHWFWEAL